MKLPQTAQRIVLKLGTNVVVGGDGALARSRLEGLSLQIAELWQRERQLLVVSSGAVGLGRRRLPELANPSRVLTLTEKQVAAAIGQSLLMEAYRGLFGQHGIETAQILVTAQDFSDRTRYLSLRQTLEKLLQLRVIPIINENDVLSTMELDEGVYARSFGDNDKLSALVAAKLDADLLIVLTDVDGLYDTNPRTSAAARRIERITSFEELAQIRTSGRSLEGRGGMTAKLEAARVASISGVTMLICSGLQQNALRCLFDGEETDPLPGTLILASSPPPKRRQWIGLVAGRFGTVRVNAGASQALLSRHASLLPVGITAVSGEFQPGQVVSIIDEQDREIGRGIAGISSRELARVIGLRSDQVRELMGGGTPIEVVHRDNLVILQEHLTDRGPDAQGS